MKTGLYQWSGSNVKVTSRGALMLKRKKCVYVGVVCVLGGSDGRVVEKRQAVGLGSW